MTWKALYMPGGKNPPPSKGGFLTEEEAWEWVEENWICNLCKQDIEAWKRGEEVDEEKGVFPSAFPACMCEWLVYDEDEDEEEI